jgi:2-dehydropantoate 2-reductase
VESPLGSINMPVRTVIAGELRPDYDLVLLTCKAYDLESAMDAIAPAMSGTCAVIPMLNGMAHFDRLDERFGKQNVIGGTCAINVSLGNDGVITHTGSLQRIIFGERDRSSSERTKHFAEALGRTQVDWELSGNIKQDLWEKIVFLSVLAATTCLFRGNVSEIISAPGGREAVERTLDANVQIATRAGFPPRPAALAFAHNRLTDPAGTWSASLMYDVETGRPVEGDHIIGWMLAKAREYGVDDLMLSLAFTNIKTYETRRAAGRLP